MGAFDATTGCERSPYNTHNLLLLQFSSTIVEKMMMIIISHRIMRIREEHPVFFGNVNDDGGTIA